MASQRRFPGRLDSPELRKSSSRLRGVRFVKKGRGLRKDVKKVAILAGLWPAYGRLMPGLSPAYARLMPSLCRAYAELMPGVCPAYAERMPNMPS